MFTSEDVPNEAKQQKILTLDIFSESIIATRHDTHQTFEVCPDSLQRVFSSVTLSSGLLPPRTLFFERLGPRVKIGIHVPAAVHSVKVVTLTGEEEMFRIPTPDLVFVGVGRTYGIYALRKSVISEDTRLCYAPFPNVNIDGRICFGNLNVPEAQSSNIHRVFSDFMQSRFNNDLSSGKSKSFKDNVLNLWRSIHDKKRFPVKELIYQGESKFANLVANNSRRDEHDA